MSPELRTVLLTAGLAVLVLAGPRLGAWARRLPAGLREILATGTTFVFLGALLGPHYLAVLSAGVVDQMGPILEVLLGWLGFLYGSTFELRRMRRFPAAHSGAAALESAFTLAAVAAGALLLLPVLFPAEARGSDLAAASLLLGLCAAGTAPAGLFLMAGRRGMRHREWNLLKFLSTMDDALPLLVLGGLYAFHRPPGMEGGLEATGLQWLGISVALGVVTGILCHRLFPRTGDERENTLVLLGTTALGGGAASVLGGSALFSCALAGFVFANISTRKESAYGILAGREHTIYAVFLLAAGALFEPRWDLLYVLVPAYVVLRAAGKMAGLFGATRLFHRRPRVSPALGAGMLFDGGLVLAMAVSFSRSHGGSPLVQIATTTVVLGVVLNELLAPGAAALVLLRRPGRSEC